MTISLPPRLVREVDSLARKEGRSRSELVREALRQYLARDKRWERIFSSGEEVARRTDAREGEVARVVKQHRRGLSR